MEKLQKKSSLCQKKSLNKNNIEWKTRVNICIDGKSYTRGDIIRGEWSRNNKKIYVDALKKAANAMVIDTSNANNSTNSTTPTNTKHYRGRFDSSLLPNVDVATKVDNKPTISFTTAPNVIVSPPTISQHQSMQHLHGQMYCQRNPTICR